MTRLSLPRCPNSSLAPGRSDVPVSESTRQPLTSKTQQSTSGCPPAPGVPPWSRSADGIIGILYSRCRTPGTSGSASGTSPHNKQPHQPAVVGCPSGVTLTFGELAGRAHQLVHALRAHGLGAGDIFAYALP